MESALKHRTWTTPATVHQDTQEDNAKQVCTVRAGTCTYIMYHCQGMWGKFEDCARTNCCDVSLISVLVTEFETIQETGEEDIGDEYFGFLTRFS